LYFPSVLWFSFSFLTSAQESLTQDSCAFSSPSECFLPSLYFPPIFFFFRICRNPFGPFLVGVTRAFLRSFDQGLPVSPLSPSPRARFPPPFPLHSPRLRFWLTIMSLIFTSTHMLPTPPCENSPPPPLFSPLRFSEGAGFFLLEDPQTSFSKLPPTLTLQYFSPLTNVETAPNLAYPGGCFFSRHLPPRCILPVSSLPPLSSVSSFPAHNWGRFPF